MIFFFFFFTVRFLCCSPQASALFGDPWSFPWEQDMATAYLWSGKSSNSGLDVRSDKWRISVYERYFLLHRNNIFMTRWELIRVVVVVEPVQGLGPSWKIRCDRSKGAGWVHNYFSDWHTWISSLLWALNTIKRRFCISLLSPSLAVNPLYLCGLLNFLLVPRFLKSLLTLYIIWPLKWF